VPVIAPLPLGLVDFQFNGALLALARNFAFPMLMQQLFALGLLELFEDFRLFSESHKHCQFHDFSLEADDLAHLQLIAECFKAILAGVGRLRELKHFLLEDRPVHFALEEL
jgi:hypothetical protein